MKTLQICPRNLSDVATLSWEIQKKSFFNIIIHILQIIYVSSEENESNCCSAALAVYLLLLKASYYMYSPSTASGARYRRSTCVDIDVLRLFATWAEFQDSVVYYATEQCRKKTGSMY